MALLFLVKPEPGCNIPAGIWLSIQFLFLIVEGIIIEVRERLRSSIYWSERSAQRKKLEIAIVAPKETIEMMWTLFGFFLFLSHDSIGCGD